MGGTFTGATNRPQELDEAARRRLTKRLYIPLPSSGANYYDRLTLFKRIEHYVANLLVLAMTNEEARAWIIRNLLEKDGLFKLTKEDIDTICNKTEGIPVTLWFCIVLLLIALENLLFVLDKFFLFFDAGVPQSHVYL